MKYGLKTLIGLKLYTDELRAVAESDDDALSDRQFDELACFNDLLEGLVDRLLEERGLLLNLTDAASLRYYDPKRADRWEAWMRAEWRGVCEYAGSLGLRA